MTGESRAFTAVLQPRQRRIACAPLRPEGPGPKKQAKMDKLTKAVASIRIVRPPFRVGNKFLDSRKGNIVITSDGDEDEDFALGKLPAKEEHICSQALGMLCQGEWQPRLLVLSSEFAMICLVGSDDILDKVPLVRRGFFFWLCLI